MCLLAQINPLKPPVQHGRDDDEIRTVQLHHAHQVCGIVAHTKDHGVASVAIRSLAIAGYVLTEPREQYEVLDILKRIYVRTGWNLKRVESELKRAWGWEPPEPPLSMGGNSGTGSAAGLVRHRPHHHPGPAQPAPIEPASRGGTLGAAAVLSQLFRPHDPPIDSGTTTTPTSTTAPTAPVSNYNPADHPSRRPSQPALPLPSRPTNIRTLSSTGPTTQPLYSASSIATSTSGVRTARQTIITSPSAHGGGSSPAPTSATNVPTPASMSSSMAGNTGVATPPHTSLSGSSVLRGGNIGGGGGGSSSSSSRPMVNPLLAQADFNQPNHPYREWYKPPDRTTQAPGSGGTFGNGGLWPY